MKELNFIINRSLTDNASRELILSEEYLKFENKDIVNSTFTTFKKSEIAEYRFGVKWMTFYFTFGREYTIEIRNFENEIIKINFKTYFGRNKNQYHKLCNQILSGLWENYFNQITNDFINKHENGEEVTIGEVTFLHDGITIETNTGIKLKKAFIPWEKIKTKTYPTYFAIYAIDNASITNRGYSFLNDWNTNVLRSVILTLLERKKIE